MNAPPLDFGGGSGVLRPDPRFAQTFRGTLTIAGFPYRVTATGAIDAEGKLLHLRCDVAPPGLPPE